MTSHAYDDKRVIPILAAQAGAIQPDKEGVYLNAEDVDLAIYDHIIVCLSGGKDSIASFLMLLDKGVDLSKVEFWHHDVDGREGSHLMDWAFMADYVREFALHFKVPLYFSWLEGGFEREMLKSDSLPMPHKIETPEGLITLPRDRAKPGTRLKFPQQSANLQTRWCSSAVKIDVGRRALNNQDRFKGRKVLFITGERRQESANRAKYNQLEPHLCDTRNGRTAKHIDAWRPILNWSEEQVWAIIERYSIIAPVPYRLGWGRSSCQTCIYNSPQIWATMLEHFPERVNAIAQYEKQFNLAISRSKKDVLTLAKEATPFIIDDREALQQAMQTQYTLPVVLQPGEKWQLPAGAYGHESCGSV